MPDYASWIAEKRAEAEALGGKPLRNLPGAGQEFDLPRTRTANATTATHEGAGFNHKAALALRDHGASRQEIADVLAVAPRSVRRFLSTPCPEYEVEKAERSQRQAHEKAARNGTPFVRDDDFVSDCAIKVRNVREQIRAMRPEGRPKAEIARNLGISRQLLRYHETRLLKTAA